MTLNKQQICHYLVENKIDYAVDITNRLPIYQRNIIRQKLDNLSKEKKKSLEKEIKEKNRELRKIKKLVKVATRQLIISRSVLKLDTIDKYPSEVYLRLLYAWINQATGGILQKRKKKLLNEIYKQLFLSKKNKLILGDYLNFIQSPNPLNGRFLSYGARASFGERLACPQCG